ncbi:MAG: hypothetical protein AB8B60_16610 [Sulfitobacter sp.]
MPEPRTAPNTSPKPLLDISPDRVPRFANQSSADQDLIATMAQLNRDLLCGEPRAQETAQEALLRAGFIRAEQEG